MADLSRMPGVLNIKCYQGDTLDLPLLFKNKVGDPIDITGGVFTAHILDTIADDSQSIPVVMTCTVIDGPNGVLEVVLDATDSTPLNGPYVYDIQGVVNGKTRTYVGGTLTIEGEVTRE